MADTKSGAAPGSTARRSASAQASRQTAKETAESLASAHAEIAKLRESNERMSQQMQALGGFGTLINVLENSLGNVVEELAPLKELSPPQTAEPLDARVGARLGRLERSLDRVRSDSYTIPFTEVDVGFLHDTPVPAEEDPVETPPNPYPEKRTGAAS